MGLAYRFETKVNKNPVWKFFLKAETSISTVCAFIGVLGVCYNVVGRYIFHKNFFGMDDLLMIVMIFMYFLGSAFASYDEQQISADILTSFMKNPLKIKSLRAFQEGASALVCGVYTVWLFEYVSYNFAGNSRTPVLKVPYWIPQSALLIGFFFMTVYHIYNMILYVLRTIDLKNAEKEAA